MSAHEQNRTETGGENGARIDEGGGPAAKGYVLQEPKPRVKPHLNCEAILLAVWWKFGGFDSLLGKATTVEA